MTRALVLWALLCGAAQAQIGPTLGSPLGPAIGPAFQSAAGLPDDTPWWKSGPLITPDANTVAHVIWRNGALVDLKGNSWTMNGTVPQVAASGYIPPGAGSFSAANYYSLGAGSVLNFAGTFSVCWVFIPSSFTGAPALGSNTDGSTVGWWADITAAGALRAVTRPAGVSTTGNGASIGAVSVACMGATGVTVPSKVNLGAVVANGSTYTASAVPVATLGVSTGGAQPFAGTLLEAWFSTTSPSDGLFTAIANQVASRTRRSLP